MIFVFFFFVHFKIKVVKLVKRKSSAPIKMATIKEMPTTIPVRRTVSCLLGQETLFISIRTSFKKVIGDVILKDFSISDKIRQRQNYFNLPVSLCSVTRRQFLQYFRNTSFAGVLVLFFSLT